MPKIIVACPSVPGGRTCNSSSCFVGCGGVPMPPPGPPRQPESQSCAAAGPGHGATARATRLPASQARHGRARTRPRPGRPGSQRARPVTVPGDSDRDPAAAATSLAGGAFRPGLHITTRDAASMTRPPAGTSRTLTPSRTRPGPAGRHDEAAKRRWHQRNPQGVIKSHYMHYIAITC